MKPDAESLLSLLRKACFRNQHIKINAVVLSHRGGNGVNKWTRRINQLCFNIFIIHISLFFLEATQLFLDGRYFCCPKIYSFNNFPPSPPLPEPISAPYQWTGTRLRSSLEQPTLVHFTTSFGKRWTFLTMHRKILRTNGRTSTDPLLSGNRALTPTDIAVFAIQSDRSPSTSHTSSGLDLTNQGDCWWAKAEQLLTETLGGGHCLTVFVFIVADLLRSPQTSSDS